MASDVHSFALPLSSLSFSESLSLSLSLSLSHPQTLARSLSPLAAHTQMFGAGSGVDAFRRAVLGEPANTKAQMALKFAEEDSASKSEAIINGIIKP